MRLGSRKFSNGSVLIQQVKFCTSNGLWPHLIFKSSAIGTNWSRSRHISNTYQYIYTNIINIDYVIFRRFLSSYAVSTHINLQPCKEISTNSQVKGTQISRILLFKYPSEFPSMAEPGLDSSSTQCLVHHPVVFAFSRMRPCSGAKETALMRRRWDRWHFQSG